MKFSLIIPVYNRPDELDELLASLTKQLFTDFEVVIVEDGSDIKSEHIIKDYSSSLNIQYFYKKNEGPSIGRSFGATKAKGEYLIFTDSDCILPTTYLTIIYDKLKKETDVFGGPDSAHPDFNNVQKSISYSMTSLLTTGGVRGKEKSVEKFYPRSFNMGIRKAVFEEIGGFPKTTMWPGEDMVMAIELIKRQYNLQYIHDAFVYHKRRTSIKKFFKQVSHFGKVRIYISQLYPDTFKIIYLFPLAFVLFTLISILMGTLINVLFLMPLVVYLLLIMIDSSIRNKSLPVGLLSVITSLTQFFGYATGFSKSMFQTYILKNPEYTLVREELFNPIDRIRNSD